MSYRLITILLLIALLLGAGFFFLRGSSPNQSGQTDNSQLSTDNSSGSKLEVPKPVVKEVEAEPLTKEFTHPTFRFSVKYPESFSVTRIPGEEGEETVLFQGHEGKAGIQIAVGPFDEAGSVLTKERIEADIPGFEVRDPQDVLLGTSGKGLAFLGHNADGQETREVWFVFGGRLYQITTYPELDSVLPKMLNTWKFF